MLYVKSRISKLLVASVFGPDFLGGNRQLYNLQIKCLKSTCQFDHIVFLDREEKSNFTESKCIGSIGDEITEKDGSIRHSIGLNFCIKYALENINDYDYLLILDSDAFPIKKNWLEELIRKTASYDGSAVIRLENFDEFPHPCVHFIKRESFDKINFSCDETINLIKEKTKDTHSNFENFYPLLRSNMINEHPLFFGLYDDLFYHHGAISRTGISRAGNYHQKNLTIKQQKENFKKFIIDPLNHIGNLRGNFNNLVL